ncbi:MAG: pyridoxal-phosphate dependent enzyme, partial [Pseudomonadales bacterium]|nr:pyridoxal-phosphate dependent enzyme [Pseudomonadales bacterium]
MAALPSLPTQTVLHVNPELDPQAIEAAHREISPWLVDTPLTLSSTLSDICGCQTLFKLENLQMTGSFKERGALNRLLRLSEDERKRGVIAASAGNHAQAVAYHGHRLGISTRIVMPRYSPLVKIRSTEHWHAEVTLEGDTFDDAYAWSQQIVEQENRVYIHPFDDPVVAQGPGT